ncbi:MAG: ankyrin repeat domain-containing protein [Gammaproteobacteria bacterium]|nr:ankyrin repeat domain-containing protein [Gammaproteobacteria bacterium]
MKKIILTFGVCIVTIFLNTAFANHSHKDCRRHLDLDDLKPYVTFSLLSYDPWEQPSVPLPEGWDYFIPMPDSLNSNGYYAASFIKIVHDIGTQCYIIIASRGTTFSVHDAFEDFLMLMGKAPYDYIANAREYYLLVANAAEKHYPWPYITVTGHSLGAVLANMFAAGCHPYELSFSASQTRQNANYGNGYPVLFDNPGAAPIIKDLVNKKVLPEECEDGVVGNFFSAPNAINTINEQEISSLESLFYVYFFDHETFALPPFIGSPGRDYFWSIFTLNQHHISNFYDAIQNETCPNLEIKKNWPIGLEQAYKYSISAYGDCSKREEEGYGACFTKYWDSMIGSVWNMYPSIQSKYSFSDFHDVFVKAIKADTYYPALDVLSSKNKTSEPQIDQSISQDDDLSVSAAEKAYIGTKEFYEQFKDIKKRPTLREIVNNDFDQKSAQRKQIYLTASIDKKLYYAVMFGDTKLAEKLIQNNKNINLNSQHGEGHFSLLQIAIMFGYLDMVETLISHSANANLADDFGNTALHTVASERYGDAGDYAQVLLKGGVNPNIKNKKGETALMTMKIKHPQNAGAFNKVLNQYLKP